MPTNAIPTRELISLGTSDTPYDRFLFNSRGDHCAVWSSLNGEALIVRLGSGVSTIPLGDGVGFATAFHRDEDIVAFCRMDATMDDIRLYNFPSGSIKASLPLPAGCSLTADLPVALAFDRAGKRLAFGMGPSVYLFDVDNTKVIDFWRMNDKSMILGIDEDFHLCTVSDFDRESASFSVTPYKTGQAVFWTSISPLTRPRSSNYRNVYFCLDNPHWRSEVRSLPTGERRLFLPYSKSMVFCNGGDFVVQQIQEPRLSSAVAQNNILVCWDVPRKALLGLVEVDAPFLLLAGADSSSRIAIVRTPSSISPKGRIDILSLDKLELVAQVQTEDLAVKSVAMSPLGDYIIASVDGTYSQAGVFHERLPSELFYADLSQL